MIKTLIIDDEESTINVIKLLLQKHLPQLLHIDTAIGAAKGLLALRNIKPDLVFLDIEMPLLNGFQLLEQFPAHDFEVIFVTAYDHYAIKAIKLSALDYLLKPVDAEELKIAVNRFLNKQKIEPSQALYQNFLHNIHSSESEYKLALTTSEGTFFYKTDEIIRCEATGNYTRFIFKDRKTLLTSKTLKEYDELLTERHFIRVHRTHLVNKKYIISFTADHDLTMADGSVVEVSRRRWEIVKHKLTR